MEHLIVAFDDSPAAHSAAQWAFGLAATHDARVTLVYLAAGAIPPSEEDRYRVRDAAVEQAQLARDRSRNGAAAAVGYVDLPGDPVDAMRTIAEDLDADLIVIGTDERRAATVHALARELLDDGGASVAVIPTGMQPPDLDTAWVVAVDGSSHDRAPLWFTRVAVHDPARITAVLAYQPQADTFPHPAEPAWTYPGELDARRQVDDIGPVGAFRREPGPAADAVRRVAAGPAPTTVIVVAGSEPRGPAVLTHAPVLGRLGAAGRLDDELLATPDGHAVIVVPPQLGLPAAAWLDRAVPGGSAVSTDAGPTTGQAAESTVGEAAARVADSERRRGGDSSRHHIVERDDQRPRTVGQIQRNDHENLAAVGRPAALVAAAAGLTAGVVALAACLLAGSGSLVTTVVTIGASVAGLVVGGLAGLYRNVVMNRDVIDLRGAENAEATVTETPHAATTTSTEGLGYVQERELLDDEQHDDEQHDIERHTRH